MNTAPIRRSRAFRLAVLALAVIATCGEGRASEPARPLTVLAAASLTDALQRIGDRYQTATGRVVRFSFGSSSALARQIEAGSPADLFVSADAEWMDYLERRQLIKAASRQDLLGNRLVLVAPADSKVNLRIGPNFGLRAALGQGRLATGDPESVPVGKYAKAALLNLGVWDSVADRLVRADNVRGALMFVARGEAPFGIVYETDARIDPAVRIVDVFPASSHAPIVYPVALTSSAMTGADQFESYLRGEVARGIFEALGFTVRSELKTH